VIQGPDRKTTFLKYFAIFFIVVRILNGMELSEAKGRGVFASQDKVGIRRADEYGLGALSVLPQ
jgi:hypothetical protein